jgi:hypothetical protein
LSCIRLSWHQHVCWHMRSCSNEFKTATSECTRAAYLARCNGAPGPSVPRLMSVFDLVLYALCQHLLAFANVRSPKSYHRHLLTLCSTTSPCHRQLA